MSDARTWISRLLLHAPESVRSLRKIPGLGRVIHAFSHRVIPTDDKIWTKVEAGPSKGLWLELNPRTGHPYALGTVEASVQQFLVERLNRNDVFYDLGANIGVFSLLAARVVGEDGKVFSFEPDSTNAERLRRNIARNQFTNVTVVEAGVWSETCDRQFAAAEPSSPDRGVGTFITDKLPDSAHLVHCVALDDYVNCAAAPNGIKCDVEGAELEVLKGAKATLNNYGPWILCEMHSPENDRAAREFLAGLGYSCEDVDETHIFAAP
jgi:FkbM family methyltransferase